jgi:competence protein ComEC
LPIRVNGWTQNFAALVDSKGMRRPPLLAVAGAFAIGIAAAAGPLAAEPLPFVFVAGALALASRRRPWLILALAAALGGARGACDTATHRRAVASIDVRSAVEERWHRGEVEEVEPTGAGYRMLIDAEAGRLLVVVNGRSGAPPLPGDRVAVLGRLAFGPRYLSPGADDPSWRLRARGAAALIATGADRVAITGVARRVSGARLAARMQRRVSKRIAARGGDRAGSAIASALAAGDRSAIDDELSTALRRAGIGHLLAVSGLHLAVVGLFVFVVTRRLWAAIGPLATRIEPATAAAIAALITASGYAAMTGGRPSAMRALWVVAAILVARIRWRRVTVTAALGLAGLVLLAHRPALLRDPGFQMSFCAAATLALVFAGRARRPGWRGAVGSLVACSAWALAATAPTAAALFGELAPAGIAANLVAVPAVELAILPLALGGAALSAIAPAAGGLLLDAAIAGAGAIARFAEAVAWAAPTMAVPGPGRIEAVVAGIAIAAAVIAARRRRGAAAAVAVAVAAAATAAVAVSIAAGPPTGDRLRIAFLDVGHGDAAVLELPGGEVWLIDAGGLPFVIDAAGGDQARRRGEGPGRDSVLRYLRHRRIERLDRVALSHPHPDHFLGLGALAGEIEIGEVWLVAAHAEQPIPPSLAALLTSLRVLGAEIRSPPPALVISGPVVLEALAPRYRGRVAADPVSSVNDNSLLLRVSFAGRRILFTGDLEREGEELALDRLGPAALAADVVKVPHHGSATSSTARLVAATGAAVAVISCGSGNRFDFPDPDVVDRWRRAGAAIARTDVDGAVVITIEAGGAMRVERFARRY